MDYILWLEVIFFILLLGFSAFFSSSETALFSLDSFHLEKMRKDGDQNVNLIQKLLAEPRRLIVTILIGNEFVNVTASVISTSIIIQIFGAENKFYNLFIMVPILLIFGEITPKTLAIRNKTSFASFESRPIALFSKIISPLRLIIRYISDFFITMIIGKERSRGNLVTEDMVRTLAQDAAIKGALDKQEAGFIERIFKFGSLQLDDILTPRADITYISIKTSIADIIKIHRSVHHSRYPVYDGHRDNVIGVLHARDLLNIIEGHENNKLTKLMREPYFVPETLSAIRLFDDFQTNKRSFTLTVDEYGGVTGLVTMEDLLECVFGDIPSQSDRKTKSYIIKKANNIFQIDGTILLNEFNQFFDSKLHHDGIKTLSGFVLNTIGNLPEKNSTIDIDGFRFTIIKISRNRLEELQVKKLTLPTINNSPDKIEEINKNND